MISNAQIKTIASYKLAKFRNQDEVFVVEGVKMVDELLRSNHTIEMICATKNWIEEHKKIASQINLNIQEIKTQDLERISSLTTPNQVLAIVKRKESKPIELKSQLVIALDEIKDPGNLGTIVRIADWFGIENIICSENTVDIYNPKAIQATMGSLFRINITYNNLFQYLQTIPSSHPIYGTIIEGGKNLYQENLQQEGIIVIGSESHGISQEIKQLITHPLTIPSFSKEQGPESLNASIATSIICSEFRRK
ncbi:MAG: RNA methyltransferase [Bacteroidales bacterium]|jgi:TrmH family RNA methyltransferase|nr:RNA methyltransferase [Bacteroidales bacterium]MDD4830208.1 RNA methyltransferase [Bacteroidales bacterium]